MTGCGGDWDRTSGYSYTNRPPTESVVLERIDPEARPVVQVVSGDTVVVDLDGVKTAIKIIGIEAPDAKSSDDRERCLAEKSAEHLKSVLPDTGVRVHYQDGQPRTDAQGNTRAHLTGRMTLSSSVAVEQLTPGWARRVSDPADAMNSIHDGMHMQIDAEKSARAAQVGVWDPDECR
jgi:endonuclease YncB( thermonuclease family)